MGKKSKSKSKSKRTSKPRTSRIGLIAGLSIGGVVALIVGALVLMYFMGVFGDLFKKKSKPRVNDKSRVNDKQSMLDTFETSYDSNSYESIIKQLNEQSYIELNKGKDGSYFIRDFGVNAESSIEVRNVDLDNINNVLEFEQLQKDKWISYKITSNPNKVTLKSVGTRKSKYVYYPDKGTVIVYIIVKRKEYPLMTLSDTVFK